MKEQKKFWMLPIIICLPLLGSLIVLTSGFGRGAVYPHLVLNSDEMAQTPEY
jgi:hypothetical protein